MRQIRYNFQDLLAMLGTPLGRLQWMKGIHRHAWPLLAPLARGYRLGPGAGIRFVAVVGSLGKTTTERAVTRALGRPDHRKVHLNFGTHIAACILRTPPWRRYATLEVGIGETGQMAPFARIIRPWAAVVTAVASEHNRALGTLERTREEKAHMVRALPADGWAFLNGDDTNVLWMRSQTRARVLTFGFGADCDVRARGYRVIEQAGMGMEFEAWIAGQWHPVRSRLLGRHMVYPLLAALSVAGIAGIPTELVLDRLQELSPTAGRLQAVSVSGGVWIIRDDFKGSLETIHAALDTLAEIPAQRRIVVLGDVSEPPGPPGPICRDIGKRVAGIADVAIFMGKSPRRYAAEAFRCGMSRDRMRRLGDDVQAGIRELRAIVQPGDVVLIKGRYSQRLGRIALALEGREVQCDIGFCDARAVDCQYCPMLERGWEGRRVVV